MAMDVEALNGSWEMFWRREIGSQHAKAGAWSTRIVKLGFNLAVFGVDAKAEGDCWTGDLPISRIDGR